MIDDLVIYYLRFGGSVGVAEGEGVEGGDPGHFIDRVGDFAAAGVEVDGTYFEDRAFVPEQSVKIAVGGWAGEVIEPVDGFQFCIDLWSFTGVVVTESGFGFL